MKALVIIVLVALGGVAHAYPQFQMSRDQTCTGCHISPAGGGLLNENGFTVAEAISQFGTAPEFMYGKVPTPDWLTLGGDIRGAGGMFKNEPTPYFYAFPMQLELNAHAKLGPVALYVTAGGRPGTADPVPGSSGGVFVWSREHYLMWRQKPDENEGLYIRAGRFMPVFGLRFAEHPMYTRRYGGTQLFSETYGVGVSYVTPKLEVHATGFIEDYTIDPVEHANGGALYTEFRTSETVAFGVEGMVKQFTDGDSFSTEMLELRLGVTNKLYLSGLDVLLQTELQFVNQLVDKVNRSPASQIGGAPKGIVGNLVASKMLGDFLLLDIGIGHFDSNYRISNLDRDAFDLNLHWFATSHLELVLNGRYELIGFGNGGTPGAYGMLQLHYRL